MLRFTGLILSILLLSDIQGLTQPQEIPHKIYSLRHVPAHILIDVVAPIWADRAVNFSRANYILDKLSLKELQAGSRLHSICLKN